MQKNLIALLASLGILSPCFCMEPTVQEGTDTQARANAGSLGALPQELFEQILQSFTLRELASVACVCRYGHSVANEACVMYQAAENSTPNDAQKRLMTAIASDYENIVRALTIYKRRRLHESDIYTVLKWAASFGKAALANAMLKAYGLRINLSDIVETMFDLALSSAHPQADQVVMMLVDYPLPWVRPEACPQIIKKRLEKALVQAKKSGHTETASLLTDRLSQIVCLN